MTARLRAQRAERAGRPKTAERNERAERVLGLMRLRRSGDLLAALSLDAEWERRLRAATSHSGSGRTADDREGS